MTPALSPLSSSCTHPFQQLSVDLVTGLPPSHGFDSLMVMVNHGLLKGVILTPCNKNIDTKEVAELFVNNVFLHFRLHNYLISDQGPQFTSTFSTELAHILGYDLKLSTTYHLQMDREMEQVNQEVEMYLRMFCQGHPNKWSEFSPMVKFTHNSATCYDPFPHCSVLLFIHSRCLCTWRGRSYSYINMSYLLVCTLSSFCFFDLSMDLVLQSFSLITPFCSLFILTVYLPGEVDIIPI